MQVSHVGFTAVSLLAAACGTDPVLCTDSTEPAITAAAFDAATGENVTDGARGAVAEGTFVDSLRPQEWDGQGRVFLLRAADERPGTYGLFLEREGYQAVSLSEIEVTMGECHVNTEDVRVTMVRIP